MDYTRLGGSGLKVSRIALGCMALRHLPRPRVGARRRGRRADLPAGRRAWHHLLGHRERRHRGSSEEITGRAIKEYSRREDAVLATKVFFPMHDGPGGSGLSRKAILEQVDASLTRLGTDYVDVTRSTASTPTLRSRRRWRRCTTW